ncbi:hypothetical protein QTN25_008589 [Entamoeba marina]
MNPNHSFFNYDSSVNSGTSPANEHSHIPSVPKKESPRRRHRSEEGSGRRRRSRSRSSSRGRGHSRSHSKRRRRSDSRRRHSESRRHRDRSRRRISNENKDKLKKKKNVKYSSDDAKKLKHDGDRLFKEESTKDKGMLCYCESVIGYAQIVERKEMEREHMFSYFSFVFGLALKINNPELGDGIKKILSKLELFLSLLCVPFAKKYTCGLPPMEDFIAQMLVDLDRLRNKYCFIEMKKYNR